MGFLSIKFTSFDKRVSICPQQSTNTYQTENTSIYVLIIIFVDSELGINIFNPLLILIPHSQVLGPKAIISVSDPCQQNHHQNRTVSE